MNPFESSGVYPVLLFFCLNFILKVKKIIYYYDYVHNFVIYFEIMLENVQVIINVQHMLEYYNEQECVEM